MNCNVHLQSMDELSAPRYIMTMIASICQRCNEQQFRNTVMCRSTLREFLSGKVGFMHTSTVTRSHLCSEKTRRTPRVHLVIVLEYTSERISLPYTIQ